MGNNYKPDKEERIYKIEGVGEYPSVTTVIGLLDKSGALMNWSARIVVEYLQSHQQELANDPIETYKKARLYYKQLQTEAKDFGSALHNCIEVYLRGQKVDGLLEEIPALKQPLAEFIKWQTANDFKLVEAEHIVWSENYRFAGTLDCICYKNGKLYLVDFKSSKAIYDDFLMQISAYRVGYEERSGREIQGLGILRLPKNETDAYEWREWTLGEANDSFDEFMCLVSFWWERARNKKEWLKK